jgi:hypothetical protein
MATRPSQHTPLYWPKRKRPTRTIAFGQFQDAFLIAAVATILIIRLQLKLTNYPKLGGGTLHIGHILWGGLLMLVAIGLLLTVLDRRWRLPAALLGGVGFGFFIDEIGKFITSNNDYFFKPSAAIIYIAFICIYLLTRWIRQRSDLRSSEYVANALDVFSDAAAGDFTDSEKQRTLRLLDRGGDNQIAASLRELVQATPTVPTPALTRLARIASAITRRYTQVSDARWFSTLVIGIFVVIAAINAAQLVLVALWALGVDLPVDWHFTVAQAGEVISGLFAVGLIYVGIARLVSHRKLDAYRSFEYALLVGLFIEQMFAYIDRSFVATWGFLVTLLLLVSVRAVMHQELRLEQGRSSLATPQAPQSSPEHPPRAFARFRPRMPGR